MAESALGTPDRPTGEVCAVMRHGAPSSYRLALVRTLAGPLVDRSRAGPCMRW